MYDPKGYLIHTASVVPITLSLQTSMYALFRALKNIKIPTGLPEGFPAAGRQHLLHLFEACVQKGFDFQRKRCKEPVTCVDIQLVTSLSFIFQVGCRSFLECEGMPKHEKMVSCRIECQGPKAAIFVLPTKEKHHIMEISI